MATVDDLIDLVERGWAPNQIRQKLQIKPYRLRQILATRRLARLLEINRQLAHVVSGHQACISAPQAVRVLQHIVEACREPGESSRKAASQLLRLAGITGRRRGDQPEAFQQIADAMVPEANEHGTPNSRRGLQDQSVEWDESAKGRYPTKGRAHASKDESLQDRWETVPRTVSPTPPAGTNREPPTCVGDYTPHFPPGTLHLPEVRGQSGTEIFRDFPSLSAAVDGVKDHNTLTVNDLCQDEYCRMGSSPGAPLKQGAAEFGVAEFGGVKFGGVEFWGMDSGSAQFEGAT